MPVLISIIYIILAILAIVITYLYYVPYLQKSINNADLNSLTVEVADVDEMRKAQEISICRHKIVIGLMGLGCIVLSGICGYMAMLNTSSVINLIKITIAFVVLLCALVTDVKLMIIPNVYSIVLIGSRFLLFLIELVVDLRVAVGNFLNSLTALVICLLVLFLAAKLTKGGIGYGDVKLFSSLGFLCGIRAVCYTLTIAFVLSAIVSTFLLMFKVMKLKDSLPLGPFIWIGFSVSVMISML